MASALDWVNFGLGVGAAVLGSGKGDKTKQQQQEEKPKQTINQTVNKQNNQTTQVYPVNRNQNQNNNNQGYYNQNQTGNQGYYNQNQTGNTQGYYSQPQTVNNQGYINQNGNYSTSGQGYNTQQQANSSQGYARTSTSQSKKKAVPEEETYLLGFLKSLYEGDSEAIIQNTDGCESDNEFAKLVIEDSQSYVKEASAHQGYSSARVRSRNTNNGKVRLRTTVSFNDGKSSDETFYVIKNASGAWKFYVE